MHKQWWAGFLLAGCAFAASAVGGLAEVRNQAEASMLVTGAIDVDADGSVGSYEIDKREQVPAVVNDVIDRTIGKWRFQSVLQDGKPIRATSKMSLLVVAEHADADHYRVALRGATFGTQNEAKDAAKIEAKSEEVSAKRMRPPEYPAQALTSGVAATAYVVVRIGHQGTVEDALVEQVNLRAVASKIDMEQWRNVFAQSVLRAAKSWTFVVPTAVDTVDAPFWTARVPVAFQLGGRPAPKYGQWQAYIPGPRKTARWLQDHGHDLDDWSLPDSQVAGTLHQVGRGLHLLTPHDQG